MKIGDLILLFSHDESYLIRFKGRDFNTRSGLISSQMLLKSKVGGKIKTHIGKEFVILKANVRDYLEKIAKRGPQIIMSKDASLILSQTGVSPSSLVVDAGTGSGFLAIFLANYISSGRVVSYEIDPRWFKVAKRNIEDSGMKNIVLRRKDVTKGISERKADLVTLDLHDCKKAIPHAYRSLSLGGWLAVYSPHVEQVIAVVKEIRKRGFSEPRTFENIVREWKSERTTRPRTMGLVHTGFLTFARKLK